MLDRLFARYTGQESQEERERIREQKPDILLTNFMMLELLMTRQNPLDRAVIANAHGVEFIVLDELHTYRGRQPSCSTTFERRSKPKALTACRGTSSPGISSILMIAPGLSSRAAGRLLRQRSPGSLADIRSCLGPSGFLMVELFGAITFPASLTHSHATCPFKPPHRHNSITTCVVTLCDPSQ